MAQTVSLSVDQPDFNDLRRDRRKWIRYNARDEVREFLVAGDGILRCLVSIKWAGKRSWRIDLWNEVNGAECWTVYYLSKVINASRAKGLSDISIVFEFISDQDAMLFMLSF